MERFFEGAKKVLRRQKHVLSQSSTPFACTLSKATTWATSISGVVPANQTKERSVHELSAGPNLNQKSM